MKTDATYYIAQVTPDLLRKEPANVGVFVVKGGRIAARFIGEKEPGGAIDKRKIRKLHFQDVYLQWVDYWKRVLATSADPIPALRDANGDNYNVIPGGEVADTGTDTAEDVVAYLYPLLVSDGGLRESLGLEEVALPEVAVQKLVKELDDAFDYEGILIKDRRKTLEIPNPIMKGEPIKGAKSRHLHKPSYTQKNGVMHVMEAVDFTATNKSAVKDAAGFAAFMFEDIVANFRDSMAVKTIAIVRSTDEDETSDDYKYGLDMLDGTATQMVMWNVATDRASFIRERLATAHAQHGQC